MLLPYGTLSSGSFGSYVIPTESNRYTYRSATAPYGLPRRPVRSRVVPPSIANGTQLRWRGFIFGATYRNLFPGGSVYECSQPAICSAFGQGRHRLNQVPSLALKKPT